MGSNPDECKGNDISGCATVMLPFAKSLWTLAFCFVYKTVYVIGQIFTVWEI